MSDLIKYLLYSAISMWLAWLLLLAWADAKAKKLIETPKKSLNYKRIRYTDIEAIEIEQKQ